MIDTTIHAAKRGTRTTREPRLDIARVRLTFRLTLLASTCMVETGSLCLFENHEGWGGLCILL